jgi:hypothetical protein
MGERTMMALLLVAACGGDAHETPSETAPTGAETVARDVPEGPSLHELLGSPGERRTGDELQAIASWIEEWVKDPANQLPNETGKPPAVALSEWLEASPDVMVEVCPFFDELLETEGEGDERARLSAAIEVGYPLGMAAATITNPDADPSDAQVQVAGAEAALHWYLAERRGGAPASPFMERLEAKYRADGGLHAWYAERAITCGDPDAPREPSYRRAMLGG